MVILVQYNCHECGERMKVKRFGKNGHTIEHRGKMIKIKRIINCDGCGTYYYDKYDS